MTNKILEMRPHLLGSGRDCALNPRETDRHQSSQFREQGTNRAFRRQGSPLGARVKTLLALFGALVIALTGGGCTELDRHALLIEVGVVEEPVEAPKTSDLVCDRTVGSTCDTETLGLVVEREANRLASIPGSTIRLWILDGPEPNVPAATMVVPTARRRNERTAQRQADAWTRQVRAAFVARIAEDPPDDTSTTSPLAELLTRIAAAGGTGTRRIVVVTDARQRSGVADAECRTPNEASWLSSLRRHGLLGHGSMSGIHVMFVHVAPRPLERRRCRSTVAHEATVRALWTAAFGEAGTAQFDLTAGSQEPPITPPTEFTPSEGASQ